MESASSLTQTVSIALTREGQLGRSLTRSECDELAEERGLGKSGMSLFRYIQNAKLGSNLEVKKPTGRKTNVFNPVHTFMTNNASSFNYHFSYQVMADLIKSDSKLVLHLP